MSKAGAPPEPGHDDFDQVVLQSEIYRCLSVIGLLCVALSFQFVRITVTNGKAAGFAPLVGLTAIGATIIYEITCLLYLRRRSRLRKPMPLWAMIDNTVFESTIPSVAIALIWHQGILPPAVSLATPTVLFYTLFITLSILHFKPYLCVITGALCGVQHAAMVAYAHAGGLVDGTDSISPALLYSFSTALLLNGIAAAFVAGRLRAHLHAQLAESKKRQGMQRELDIASTIQQGLLPGAPPALDGYDIAGWNKPADDTGGDYYDWQPLPDGSLAISVADVTGHGLGPALVTAFCRAYSRATMRPGAATDRIVSRINTLISEDLPPDRFVTFVVAILTPDSGSAQLLSAGHGPILIYRRRSKSVEKRSADGLPLGVMPETVYLAADPITLEPGDALVLLTDGFFEWPNKQGEQYGIERLSQAIVRALGGDTRAEPAIDQIKGEIDRFTAGTPQPDDLTIVIARRTP